MENQKKHSALWTNGFLPDIFCGLPQANAYSIYALRQGLYYWSLGGL